MLALNTLWNMDKFYWNTSTIWCQSLKQANLYRKRQSRRDKISSSVWIETLAKTQKKKQNKPTIRKTNFITSNPLSATVNCGFPISLVMCRYNRWKKVQSSHITEQKSWQEQRLFDWKRGKRIGYWRKLSFSVINPQRRNQLANLEKARKSVQKYAKCVERRNPQSAEGLNNCSTKIRKSASEKRGKFLKWAVSVS